MLQTRSGHRNPTGRAKTIVINKLNDKNREIGARKEHTLKYLELLNRVRDCARKSETAANALSKASNSGNIRERETRKKQYFQCEHEYRVLRSQAMAMIRESDDPEMMRALLLRRVDRMPWAEIMRNIPARTEMDLRADVYLYLKSELGENTGDYCDCF